MRNDRENLDSASMFLGKKARESKKVCSTPASRTRENPGTPRVPGFFYALAGGVSLIFPFRALGAGDVLNKLLHAVSAVLPHFFGDVAVDIQGESG